MSIFYPKLNLPNLIQKSSKFEQFTWFPKWMYEIKIIIWIFCKNINQKSWEYIKVTDDFWFYQNLTIIYGIFRHFHSAPYSSINSQERTMWGYETLHIRKICLRRFSSFDVVVEQILQFCVHCRITRLGRCLKILIFMMKNVPKKQKSPFFRAPAEFTARGREKMGTFVFFKKSFWF